MLSVAGRGRRPIEWRLRKSSNQLYSVTVSQYHFKLIASGRNRLNGGGKKEKIGRKAFFDDHFAVGGFHLRLSPNQVYSLAYLQFRTAEIETHHHGEWRGLLLDCASIF
jgi:hypothetical protein